MVSFAKLPLIPPMMTLPHMTLPMHPSLLLKPQLLVWWLIVSFCVVFTRRWIEIINGLSVSLVHFFTTWLLHTMQWRKTITTSIKSSVAPRQSCHIYMVKMIWRKWVSMKNLTGLHLHRRNSRRSRFLPWWPAPILHRATLMKMKTWTTLRQALLRQPTPQRWRSSINLIFFRGVSPQFRSFWSFDDKGGEIWVSLQAGLLYGRFC